MQSTERYISDTYNDVSAEINNLFSTKRNLMNMTVRELGEKAGVSYTVIYDLEKRNILPKVETLLKIANALNFAVEIKHLNQNDSKAFYMVFAENGFCAEKICMGTASPKTKQQDIDKEITKLYQKKGLYPDEIKEIQNYINFKLSQH